MKNNIHIKKVFNITVLILLAGTIISCGESKEMIRKRQVEKYISAAREKAQKNQEVFDKALTEMTSKYKNILDLRDDNISDFLVKAYNNPEENPDISNSTETSQNEFQYLKDKDNYKTWRSKKYAMIGLYVYGNNLPKYNFEKKQFTITYDRINLMSPENNVIYPGKRPPVVDLILKNKKEVKLSIEPEEAEKFKSGITVTGGGGYYSAPAEKKDTAIIYLIFQINGKVTDGNRQHISADIVDYICVWFVDVGSKLSLCKDKIECASEIIVFKK